MLSPRAVAAAAVALAAALTPSAAHAALPSIWSPVASGTTSTITAIDHQGAGRSWFVTQGGQVFRDPGSGFAAVGSSGGAPLNDIAFGPSGLTGLAVGQGGKVLRSTDGGASWAPATIPATVKNQSCAAASSVASTVLNLTAVSFGDDGTAYVVGGAATAQQVVLKTTNGGATFAEVNYVSDGVCTYKESSAGDLTDVQASSPTVVTAVARGFGKVVRSFDGWATASPTGEMVNEFQGLPRISVDAANPATIIAVDHSGGGNNCGGICFKRSDDGGATSTAVAWLPERPTPLNTWDIDRGGATVVGVGDNGLIGTSPDGLTFYPRPADGALAAQPWRAVGVAPDGASALVGGTGGALVRSAAANTVPDVTRPTVTLNGPLIAYVGQPATFTATVADTGGSGVDLASQTFSGNGLETRTGSSSTQYTFTSTGSFTVKFDVKDNAGNAAEQASRFVSVERPTGASTGARPSSASLGGGNTVTIFRTVTVTGKASRFIPVRMKANGKRTFKLKLYPGTGPKKAISTKNYAFRKKGVRLGRLPLPATAGPGTYRVEVAVYKGKKRVGKRITRAVVVV